MARGGSPPLECADLAPGETREQIVQAADMLFYRQGFEHTSFSDIAVEVRISRGNFYHHFRTKDEILDAVIARRLASTQSMLEGWESAGETPADRVRSFIRMLIDNRVRIRRHGCPVGTLCTELAKLDHVARTDATGLFTLFRTWLQRQFLSMGRREDADALALHLLARSQGIATLANALRDEAFLRREVDALFAWLDELQSPDHCR